MPKKNKSQIKSFENRERPYLNTLEEKLSSAIIENERMLDVTGNINVSPFHIELDERYTSEGDIKVFKKLKEASLKLERLTLEIEKPLIDRIKSSEVKAIAKYFTLLPLIAKYSKKLSTFRDNLQVYADDYFDFFDFPIKICHWACFEMFSGFETVLHEVAVELNQLLKQNKLDNNQIEKRLADSINALITFLDFESSGFDIELAEIISLEAIVLKNIKENPLCNGYFFPEIIHFSIKPARIGPIKIWEHILDDNKKFSICILDPETPVNYDYYSSAKKFTKPGNLKLSPNLLQGIFGKTFYKYLLDSESSIPIKKNDVREAFCLNHIPNCLDIELKYKYNGKTFNSKHLVSPKRILLERYNFSHSYYSDLIALT